MTRIPASTNEPAWMQRMRAAGYSRRRGAEPGPLSEIPDVVFTPPPRREKVHPLYSRPAISYPATRSTQLPAGLRKGG
jgi:hypothetical protein